MGYKTRPSQLRAPAGVRQWHAVQARRAARTGNDAAEVSLWVWPAGQPCGPGTPARTVVAC